jgi:hypothetical protein
MTRSLAMLLAVAGCAGASAQEGRWANEGTGKPLRPGVYGRIAVKGTPPPVINATPVMVERATLDKRKEPVYLYVPPGQVRRWAEHCAKWDACSRPVYFVRVDDSPSRLGDWKRTQRVQADDSPVLQALNRFVGP